MHYSSNQDKQRQQPVALQASAAMALASYLLLLCATTANAVPLPVAQTKQWTGANNNCLAGIKPSPSNNATTFFYPWMAAIFKDIQIADDVEPQRIFYCTGSIISPSYILTAAHCMQEIEPDPVTKVCTVYEADTFRVHVGSANKLEGRKFEVAEVIPHPKAFHKNGQKSSGGNDIGLLKLKTPLQFDDPALNVAPICLGGEFAMDEKVLAAGWGGQMPPESCQQHDSNSIFLQSGPIRIVPFGSGICRLIPKHRANDPQDDDAQEDLRRQKYGDANANDICTVPVNGTLVEHGDSGGPLLKYEKGTGWRQLGITSLGDCELKHSPVIYARVSAYCEWIEEQTQREVACMQN